MGIGDIDRLKMLLEQVRLIEEKYDELNRTTGKDFNLIEAGGIMTKELFHTRLLANIFDSEGSHGQGKKFLQLFLETVGSQIVQNDDSLDPVRVICESQTDKGRFIDIVIESNYWAVGIEVKIYADDSENQLEDYYDYLKTTGKEFELYYLTLNGHEPAKKSVSEKIRNEISLISFERHILLWLESCIAEVAQVPYLREALIHYKLLVEKLVGRDENMDKEIGLLIGSDPQKMKMAGKIYRENIRCL